MPDPDELEAFMSQFLHPDQVADEGLAAKEQFLGHPDKMKAAEGEEAMVRRISLLQQGIADVLKWADDRPEEAAKLLSELRQQIRATEARLDQYRLQSRSLN